nr:alpha/beta fold hydrolase [Actinomycetota bacterium]
GQGRVHRGAQPAADLAIRTDAATLAGIVSGVLSGTEEFLAGRLTVRGDLSLSLQLDGLWRDEACPDSFPRAAVTVAMGVRTTYLEAGPPDAPPVVLLHGLGATNASLLPTLVELARDHRVLAPDLPGHGSSAAPAAPYSPAWFAAWTDAFQTVTRTRGAVLVGNSLGGRVALEAGLSHPKSIRALVLIAPSPAFRRLRQLVPVVRLTRPELARLPMVLPHRLVVEAVRTMFSNPDRLPRAWYDAAADESQRVMRSRAHRVAFFACARQIYLEEAYGRTGFWDRLPGLLPPALFVWGERDRLVPASFARHVADALPGASSVVLPDCGHVPQFELPERTHEVIRGFLDGL